MFAKSIILRQTEQASWNLERWEHKLKPSHKLRLREGRTREGESLFMFIREKEERKEGRIERREAGR